MWALRFLRYINADLSMADWVLRYINSYPSSSTTPDLRYNASSWWSVFICLKCKLYWSGVWLPKTTTSVKKKVRSSEPSAPHWNPPCLSLSQTQKRADTKAGTNAPPHAYRFNSSFNVAFICQVSTSNGRHSERRQRTWVLKCRRDNYLILS